MALVAEWLLNGTGNDTSGNDFHLTGSPKNYPDNLYAMFDGTSRPMSHPDAPAFNVQTFSIRARVLPNATIQNGFFFEKGSVNTQYSLFLGGSSLLFRTHTGSSYDDLSINFGGSGFNRTTLSGGALYDIVATYDGANKRIYVDGVEVASKALVATISTNATGVMLGQYNTNGYLYNGAMADVQFYDNALTPAEITSLYENARAIEIIPPTVKSLSSLIPVPGMAYYSFPVTGRVTPPDRHARGYIEGHTTFEDTAYGREVNLYLEVSGASNPRFAGNLSMPPYLKFVKRVFSDPDTGFFRFDNLHQGMTYTTIACDRDGLWDPAIKSGLSVTPY